MARPLRITFPGAFYHITARGNERKNVFRTKSGLERFLEYLESASQRYHAVIYAYSVADNHYHLLLGTPSENLPQIKNKLGEKPGQIIPDGWPKKAEVPAKLLKR